MVRMRKDAESGKQPKEKKGILDFLPRREQKRQQRMLALKQAQNIADGARSDLVNGLDSSDEDADEASKTENSLLLYSLLPPREEPPPLPPL